MCINIAILITVFNRKEKTLKCLDSLKNSMMQVTVKPEITVFLTDDGSTDGTAESLRNQIYPFEIKILQGDGNLYWNGGMINSWKAALNTGKDYDGFLWLNDDVIIKDNYWKELLETDKYCHGNFYKGGIYIGYYKLVFKGELIHKIEASI